MTELLNISALSLYLNMGGMVASSVVIEAPTGYRCRRSEFSLQMKVKGRAIGDLPPTPSSLAHNVSYIVRVYGPLGTLGGDDGEDVVET